MEVSNDDSSEQVVPEQPKWTPRRHFLYSPGNKVRPVARRSNSCHTRAVSNLTLHEPLAPEPRRNGEDTCIAVDPPRTPNHTYTHPSDIIWSYLEQLPNDLHNRSFEIRPDLETLFEDKQRTFPPQSDVDMEMGGCDGDSFGDADSLGNVRVIDCWGSVDVRYIDVRVIVMRWFDWSRCSVIGYAFSCMRSNSLGVTRSV